MSADPDAWLKQLGVSFDLSAGEEEGVGGDFLTGLEKGAVAVLPEGVSQALGLGRTIGPRPLTAAERAEAENIFGDSLDYSKITVDGGTETRSKTLGNGVHLRQELFVIGGPETTDEGKHILIHELTHVWQYQHRGLTLAPAVAWDLLKTKVAVGDSQVVYDWTRMLDTPWEKWTIESQAKAVEDYNRSLQNVKDGKATRTDYTRLKLLEPYVKKLFTVAAQAGDTAVG